MRIINLEEILDKVVGIETKSDAFKQEILNAMREACNQTVDLCVTVAEVTTETWTGSDWMGRERYVVNYEDIRRVKNQIV